MKKVLLPLCLSTTAAISTTHACTTWVADTDYGVTVTRSVDWDSKLGAIAHVYPKGTQLETVAVPGYAKPAKWTSKYQTLAIEEYVLFQGVAVTAINMEAGLSANGQYLDDSKPFLQEHKDSGASAVALMNATTYIASNFATATEVKEAFEKNQFQIAWGAGLAGAQHGAHFSVQDKEGNKLLIQLNRGGEQRLYYNDADLRSMTNSPLQQYQREYVSQLDMSKPETLSKLNADISPKDRNARMLFMSDKVKLKGQQLTWAQTEGKVLGVFDAAVLVPQDVVEVETGGIYPTWVSYVYNLETGSFKLRDHDTYDSIRFNFADVAKFKKPMCADLPKQAGAGKGTALWSSCDKVIPKLTVADH
ncbi:choloylglycine hydrolase [Microbulbifer donghaiensis]|uniref:Choloylglycine hydrolase n=1 Tax=Microbulbifer donghaiensis TaxID=494016 RepID=A0A1M4WYT9_9GAMM|nr:linear amide C-N hydrolase [Microbulbifer donghaiensis]SHE86431.1 choloylglycine hydrolase [Microbulbifer donghaiensis]